MLIGYVSTQPEKGYLPAIQLILKKNLIHNDHYSPFFLKTMHVSGRLDIDSKGLLVFTQCGAMTKKLIGPQSEVEKDYLVRVEGRITEEIICKLRFGLKLDEKQLKQAQVELAQPHLLDDTQKGGKAVNTPHVRACLSKCYSPQACPDRQSSLRRFT